MYTESLIAIILGTVEGITEFLPISSTGHLIIVNQLISFPSETFTTLFDVVIQLGAILSVVVYFKNKLWSFSIDTNKNTQTKILWVKTLIAVIPALVLGFLLHDFITQTLFNPLVVALALIIGGFVLIIVEYIPKKNTIATTEAMSIHTVCGIGLAQCVALIPGISRSATTIIGGMMFGATRIVATEFSFFLAIPTMLAASGYTLLKHGAEMSVDQGIVLSIGFITSFLVALGVIKFLMDYVQKHDFKVFGYYRIILGIIILLFLI